MTVVDWRHPAFAWPAPAKLNLFLHIVGRRQDGYHLLQTVFQFIDFKDFLYFQPDDGGQVRLANPLPGVAAEEDLVVRAARLLHTAAGLGRRGVRIRVQKNLPMGGGLGGGSSDAATTLVALNRLWEAGLSEDQLAELGLQLGADVPVFVRGHAAWAEGVGEKLTPVAPPEPWYVVLIPDVHVDTGKIFSASELTRDKQIITIRDFSDESTENVCEPVAKIRYPEIARAIEQLSRFAPARMTGTGACVFAAFAEKASAQQAANQLGKQFRAVLAKGMNISPLAQIVEQDNL